MSDIAANIVSRQDIVAQITMVGDKGVPGAKGDPGLTPDISGKADKTYVDTQDALKVAISDVVDNVASTSATRPLSANQGRVLNGLISSLQALLTTNDTTLDQLQEVVDYIKLNRSTLNALSIPSIAGLQTALNAKAALVHTHTSSDITDFNAATDARIALTGGGDVYGPADAADGALVLFDGITGKQLRANANVFVADDGSMSIRGLIVTSTDGSIGLISTSDGLDMATNSTGLGNVNFSVPTFTPMLGLDEVPDSHVTAEMLYEGGSAFFMDAADHKVKVHINGNTTPDVIATESYVTTSVSGKADASSLAAVATSGAYADLSDKPTIWSRNISSISTNTTAGASAKTDYVYIVSGTTTLTLPTAVGNSNRYVVKNNGSGIVTVAPNGTETLDGNTTVTIYSGDAYEFISDNTNWIAL